MIKRYDCIDQFDPVYNETVATMEEDDQGEWVKYEDVALAVQLWEVMLRMRDK